MLGPIPDDIANAIDINGPAWPYPTYVAFVEPRSAQEWRAQAFREAVSRVHEAGVAEERPFVIAHDHVEDADYDCRHPWCRRMWPMVRAAEAEAKVTAEREGGDG